MHLALWGFEDCSTSKTQARRLDAVITRLVRREDWRLDQSESMTVFVDYRSTGTFGWERGRYRSWESPKSALLELLALNSLWRRWSFMLTFVFAPGRPEYTCLLSCNGV